MMICVAHEIFLFLDQLTSWVIDWVNLSCAQLDLVCIFLNLGFHSFFFNLFLNHGSQYTALVVPHILGFLLNFLRGNSALHLECPIFLVTYWTFPDVTVQSSFVFLWISHFWYCRSFLSFCVYVKLVLSIPASYILSLNHWDRIFCRNTKLFTKWC